MFEFIIYVCISAISMLCPPLGLLLTYFAEKYL